MGQEISTLIDNVVTDLAAAWPAWNTRRYDAVLKQESKDVHIEVVISAFGMTPSDEPRGTEDLDMTVLVNADINWRFVDQATHDVDHPLDIAATLLAWCKNRYFAGSSTVGVPREALLVEEATPYMEKDMARQRYTVQWEVDLQITPRIETRGPEPVPLGAGATLGGPPYEVHINDEQVYPDS